MSGHINENEDLYSDYSRKAKQLQGFVEEFINSMGIDFIPEMEEERNQVLDSIVLTAKNTLVSLESMSEGFEALESGDISEYNL